MKRLSLLLIIGIVASLLLPFSIPTQSVDVLANGTKVVLDNGVEAIYLGETAEGKHLWQATIGGAKYLDDLVTPINARWNYDIDKNEWNTDANLFTALVKGAKVTVWYEGKSLSWQPDVFVGTKKQAVSIEQLLIYDPINENYTGNTLQWQYGDINRSVRIIEGMLSEYYTLDSLPTDDILIISHSEKDAGFIWTRPAVAWDADGKLLNLTVNGDDLTLTVAAMEGATFPITIDPDASFTGTSKDGWVGLVNQPWATVRNATTGSSLDYSGVSSGFKFAATDWHNDIYQDVFRSFFYFDTSSLPSGANITAVVCRLHGKTYGASSVSVQEGTQAATLTTADFDSFSGSEYGHTTGWSTSGYNNITFNAQGRTDINKAGITKLCAREYDHDYLDVEPPDVPFRNGGYYSEQGVGYYPLLVITYEASAAPTITTNDATYVTVTTARLNSYLTDDGGEACDVRFQYGNSTGNYTVNTTWINDTYYTGNSPYTDITSLTINTTYYFRVQAKNTVGTANGSELNFTTEATPLSPTNLTAYPSSHSVSLAWTKGAGSTNTMIRQQAGAYPANYTDGKQVYNGSMSTATDTGLSPGIIYYYRAWAESGGIYSANYTEVMTTTSAGAGEGAVPGAPDVPSGWFGTPDYTNMEDFPLYSMINDIADGFEIPRNSFWLFGALMIVAIVAIFIYWKTHSGIGAMIASSILIVIFSTAFGVPLWIIAPIMVVATGAFMYLRRV